MAEVTRSIAFSTLRDRVGQAASLLRYLKPDFIEELTEPCEVEEA